MVTDSHQGLDHQLSEIINARHYLLSSSQGNLLVMLFESSCTLWNVIYSDSPNIAAEAWGDKWFDEAVYLLSMGIVLCMCHTSEKKSVLQRKRLKSNEKTQMLWIRISKSWHKNHENFIFKFQCCEGYVLFKK